MQITKQDMLEFATIVATAVVDALKKENTNLLGNAAPKHEKTAYQKTEQLLYNYMNFKRIIKERMLEIEEIKLYGVPKNSSVQEYVQKGGLPQGIVLPEESVESAVCRIQASVKTTVQAVGMIDRGMASLKHDPYYQVLEWIYFEGRTQEDIADEMKCSQMQISKQKTRLVRELSIRLFPNQAVEEMIGTHN